MLRFITSRVVQAIPVLFLISLVSYGLMALAPGGPQAQFNQNPRITQEQIDEWLASWCLERDPDAVGIVRQYLGWLGVYNCETQSLLSEQGWPNVLPTALGGGTNGILHGDFGFSIQSGRAVADLITERIPATLILMVTALLLSVTIAILIGVIAAVKRYSLFDQSATFFSYVFYSLPTFWLGLILIYVFAVTLHWFPSQGIVDPREAPAAFNTPAYWKGFWEDPLPNIMDIASHLVLPVVTLVAVSIAADSRFVRTSMLDTLSQDYVRTARAKGLPRRRVVFRHAFRNALLPIITAVSLEIAFLFSGAIVTETIFSWPGMGRLFFEGVTDRDYFLLMGIVLIGSVFVVLMNLVADVIYAVADPQDQVLMTSAMDPRARQERVADLIQDRDEVPQDLESLEMLAPAVQEAPDQHEVALRSLSQWQLARRRFLRHRLALVGLAVFSVMLFVAVFGPVIVPFEPLFFPGATKFGGDPPSVTHIFGTDRDGRDVFAMVINGARISMTVGLFSMLIAGFVGIIVGAVAGWMGGRVDNILMRLVDVLFAIPFLFVILVAARFFGRGDVTSLVLIFGLLSWALIARLVRASFLSLREADFVDAARAVGVGGGRIAFRHILPNALGPVIVSMTLLMAANIVLESFVSFLNFGISETQISWGNALSNAQNALSLGNWWWAFFPGMAIALTVIAINFVGDGLRDALDPRTRG